MKKALLTAVLISCFALTLTSCGEETQESLTPKNTTVTDVQIITSEAAKAQGNNVDAVITEEKTEPIMEKEAAQINPEGTVLKEKPAGYSMDGSRYCDTESGIYASLTKDNDGYHLAMSQSTSGSAGEPNWFLTFTEYGRGEYSYLTDENGSLIQSNVVTVYGCDECLWLEVMAIDGMRMWEYTLYPENRLGDGCSSPAVNLSEFSYTLDNYTNKNDYYNETMPDFLDDTQKNAFANAEYLLRGRFNTAETGNKDVTIDNSIYTPTGMSFRSFVEYYYKSFSHNFTAQLLDISTQYINIGGELYVSEVAKGSSVLYTQRSFELISKNEEEIKFKLIAHYSMKNAVLEDEYNSLPENEREYDKEYTFTMNRSTTQWVFSEFNYWK